MNFLSNLTLQIQTAHHLKSIIQDPSDLAKVNSIFAGIPVPPEGDTGNFEETYKTVSYVYRAANVLATSVARLPVIIEEKIGDEWLNISDQPDFQIFKTYNDFQTHFQFWQAAILYLKLTGESPWLLERGMGNRITALYPMSPSYINVVPLTDFLPSHYEFLSGAVHQRLEVDDVYLLKYFNPNYPVRGLSPLQAAKDNIVIDIDAVKSQQQMFKNAVRPSGMFSTDKQLGDKPWERLKKELKENYAGIARTGVPLIMDNGVTFTPIGFSPTDVKLLEQRRYSKDTVMEVYGVPPVLMMRFEEASVLANADTQIKLFWEETMTSELVMLNQSFTEFLLPQITKKKNVRFRFDTSKVSALQPDREKLAKLYDTGFKMGASSPNDYTVNVLGLPASDDPAADLRFIPMNLIPLGDTGDSPDNNTDDKKSLIQLTDGLAMLSGKSDVEIITEKISRRSRELFIEMQKAQASGSTTRLITRPGKAFEKVLVKLFDAQIKEIISNLLANKSLKIASAIREMGITIKENPPGSKEKYTATGVNFNFKVWAKRFADAGEPFIAEALTIAGNDMSVSIGESFLFDAEAVAWAEQRSVLYADLVNTTTADKINKLVAQGLEKNLTVDQLAVLLADNFNSSRFMRAARISRTEMVTAGNSGRLVSMKQSKRIKHHMWVTQRDSDVRDLHADALDGTVVVLGDSFPNNDGSDSAFPSSPNERCFTIPVKVESKKKK